MGSSTLNTTIESLFTTAWAAATPIAYDNVNFTPPVEASWVEIQVKDGNSDSVTIGVSPKLRRTVGTVFINIYTVKGKGSKAVRVLADNVKAVFRDLRVNGVSFFEGDINIFGEKYYTNSGTGVPATAQWYQAAVAIPFKYDEVL